AGGPAAHHGGLPSDEGCRRHRVWRAVRASRVRAWCRGLRHEGREAGSTRRGRGRRCLNYLTESEILQFAARRRSAAQVGYVCTTWISTTGSWSLPTVDRELHIPTCASRGWLAAPHGRPGEPVVRSALAAGTAPFGGSVVRFARVKTHGV